MGFFNEINERLEMSTMHPVQFLETEIMVHEARMDTIIRFAQESADNVPEHILLKFTEIQNNLRVLRLMLEREIEAQTTGVVLHAGISGGEIEPSLEN